MSWLDEVKNIVGGAASDVVDRGRAIAAGIFDAAAGRIAPSYSGMIDGPERGPIYGVDPGGVTRTDQAFYDSRGRLLQRDIYGYQERQYQGGNGYGEFDPRNASGIASNLGFPETIAQFATNPVFLLAAAGLVIGGILISRK